MQTIIDADSILFKAACTAKNKYDVRTSIKDILAEIDRECFMNEIRIAIKGRGNFRYNCYSDYKSNRKPIDPKIKEFLNYGHGWIFDNYPCTQADGMEADDLVSIWCWELLNEETPFILAHIDKDLNQIPGNHYNYNKKTHYTVSAIEGYRMLCEQWLQGDSTDGIPGIPGVGPKAAQKALMGIPMERWERRVRAIYRSKKLSKKYCKQMYDCVYMLQNWEEFYEHEPSLRPQASVGKPDVLSGEAEDTGLQGVSG